MRTEKTPVDSRRSPRGSIRYSKKFSTGPIHRAPKLSAKKKQIKFSIPAEIRNHIMACSVLGRWSEVSRVMPLFQELMTLRPDGTPRQFDCFGLGIDVDDRGLPMWEYVALVHGDDLPETWDGVFTIEDLKSLYHEAQQKSEEQQLNPGDE